MISLGVAARLLLGSMLMAWLAASVPETSSDFHARYGTPDVERFVVTPHLSLTVEYGSDGQACRMRVEDLHRYGQFLFTDPSKGSAGKPVLNPAISMDEVAVVLDEVVPPESRGKELGPGKPVGPFFDGQLPPTEYENVTFVPYYRFAQRPPAPRGMDVLLKRPDCQSLPKYSDK
jgi:hypothetical protein